jgi:phosphate transport system substrate-binding protein
MLQKKDTSIATLALLLALAVVPKPATASQKNLLILAQSPTSPNTITLPKSVKSGTRVRIDGSSSVAKFNQALKERFEKEYPGTKVNVAYRGTTAALKSLLKGNIDIAAIGRPLTDKEKSLGLVAVALPRTKIAVIVGPKNTFRGSITDAQFARIFRGEIRDWSKVGGKRGRIRLIDRPRNSDTRQALQNYPVFRNRPFRSGSNALRLSQDSTNAVINQLGTNGISYAISNQVVERPNVRLVSMHKVLTDDPRYPFSQPVSYVYRGKNPTPAALAFLGFASAPAGQQVVKAAAFVPVATSAPPAIGQTPTKPPAAAATTPNPTPAPLAETQQTNTRGGLGWLWWLIPLLALLGIPIWWLLRNRRTSTIAPGSQTPPPPLPGGATREAPSQPIVPPATSTTETSGISSTEPQETINTAEPLWGEELLPTTDTTSETATPAPATNWLGGATVIGAAAAIPREWGSSITLRAENSQSQQVLAAWQVSEAHKQAVLEQGGRHLAIRLYDISDIDQIQTEGWQIFQQFNVEEQANEILLPILVGDRDYNAEIGYLTEDERWLPLAKSNPIYIPASVPSVTEVIPPAPAPLIPTTPADWGSSITLTPESNQLALAAWQVSHRHKQALQQQGGKQLVLRIYDVTVETFHETSLLDEQIPANFPQFAVDEQATQMLVAIPESNRDYLAEIGYLTDDNRWLLLARSAPVPIVPSIPTVAPSAATIPTLVVTSTPTTSSINLTPFNNHQAIAAWQISEEHKQTLQQQGGRQLALRLYDVTEIPAQPGTENWGIFQQFLVDEQINQMLLPILVSDRNYAAEIGYLTEDDTPYGTLRERWLLLARSAPITISSDTPPSTEIDLAPGVVAALGSTPVTSTISLAPETPTQIIANWQVSSNHKQALQQQGGRYLLLRLYDVTEIDLTGQEPPIFQQFAVDEHEEQQLLEIPVGERNYAAEIGYLTDDNRWLLLARSAPIHIVSSVSPVTEIIPEIDEASPVSPVTEIIPEIDEASPVSPVTEIIPEIGEASPVSPVTEIIPEIDEVPPVSAVTKIIPEIDEVPPVSPVAEIIPEIDAATSASRITEIIEITPALNTTPNDWNSTIALRAQNSRQALAIWQVSYEHKQALRQQGGRQLALRLYDVTEIDLSQDNPQIFQQFSIDEQVNQTLLPIPLIDRDYVAEIGYLTDDENWLMAARSIPLRIVCDLLPATEIDLGNLGAVVSEVTDIPSIVDDSDDTQSEIEAAKFNLGLEEFTPEVLAAVDEGLPDLPSGYDESRIVLMPRDPQWAYTYWDIPRIHKEELRQQGGSQLALRFYDVTDVDMDYQNPHSVQEFECDEMGREWYLPVPVSDRDYIVEIGYLTNDGRWLMLARSNSIRVPPLYPSSWSNDQFITIRWEEELENKQFLDLGSPTPEAIATPANAFHDSFFGNMPTPNLAAQTVSSYIFPSGIGQWASGVGFSKEAVPERSRQFWLMADAELVVYGATAPDAAITIGGRPIKANSDGTFRFQLSFQDGMLDFPIEAYTPDGEQTCSIHLKFNRETPLRNTNTKEEAQEE